MTYDPELDYVYMPVSGPTNEIVRAAIARATTCLPKALVCVEAKTGKRVWHFQIDHHGLWDYDLPAHPILGDITVDGRAIKAVIQVTKQGFTFVFDRKTGEPVWPIEERPVPQSTVPGRADLADAAVSDKAAAFHAAGSHRGEPHRLHARVETARARAVASSSSMVRFTRRRSREGTMFLPGVFGGANWGGGAFDPETGILYVPSRMFDGPGISSSAAGGPGLHGLRHGRRRGAGRHRPAARGATRRLMRIEGLSIFKPPYSKLTAIDMNHGEILWNTPIGQGPIHHPLLKGLEASAARRSIPRLGVLATRTLIFVNAQRLDSLGRYTPPPWKEWGDPEMDRKLLYAFDKQSGALLREIQLDGLSAAIPMTYMFGGKQYIVVATGGGEESEIVALTLPSAPAR